MVGGAVADAHVRASTGRSVFGVFLFVPEGRAAAINYLTSLKKVSFPLDRTERGPNFIRSETLPVMPAGTRFALLRQMILINDRGEPVASPIIQSVQLRTLIKGEEPAQVDHIRNEKFVLDRQRYLRGDPAVFRCIDDQAREPQVFFPTHGDDQFAPRTDGPPRTHHVVMTGCAGCHRDAGTASLHSFTRLFSESNASRNPSLQPLSFEREFSITRGFKQGHATWGLLRGYWEARAMTP
jgi:hypothetical protein